MESISKWQCKGLREAIRLKADLLRIRNLLAKCKGNKQRKHAYDTQQRREKTATTQLKFNNNTWTEAGELDHQERGEDSAIAFRT